MTEPTHPMPTPNNNAHPHVLDEAGLRPTASPTWLTIALRRLGQNDPQQAERVAKDGLRVLNEGHVLHQLNRWARHVWRPAVETSRLDRFVRRPEGATLRLLGAAASGLLTELGAAVRRCEVDAWVDVLGVMFLHDDPWKVEVGGDDWEEIGQAMRWVVEESDLHHHHDHVPIEESVEGVNELRCRVAMLQLQLDDISDVVRRNETRTKDLVTSFQFWSKLVLDELRAYKSSVDNLTTTPSPPSSTPSSSSGSAVPRPRRIFRDGKWVKHQ